MTRAPTFGDARARDYVHALNGNNWEDAYHRLIGMGDRVVHVVADALRHEADPALRQILTRVLWQTRSDGVLPWLCEALDDSHQQVWKEALDGLVAIGSERALDYLWKARQRSHTSKLRG